jgi:hypothetical protein
MNAENCDHPDDACRDGKCWHCGWVYAPPRQIPRSLRAVPEPEPGEDLDAYKLRLQRHIDRVATHVEREIDEQA